MDLLSVSIPTQYVYYYKKYVIMRIKRKINGISIFSGINLYKIKNGEKENV